MPAFDVFNGDADGICALLQLRQQFPTEATLVTGVKRDINLLRRVPAGAGDAVTVLDISLDKNRDDLKRILRGGASVLYIDHHHPGDIPDEANLTAIINVAPEVSTSALMHGHLGGVAGGWAVVGCYGDNLDATAERIAGTLTEVGDLERWKALGVLINYNAYGARIEDLHFPPDVLFQRLLPHRDPDACLNADPELFATLEAAYRDDMACAESAPRMHQDEVAVVVCFPDEPWARRVSGVYGNELANRTPARAHAVLTEMDGGYLVSVRAPLENRQGADAVCRQFATGGGRAAAAGINLLPVGDLDRFIDTLRQQYS